MSLFAKVCEGFLGITMRNSVSNDSTKSVYTYATLVDYYNFCLGIYLQFVLDRNMNIPFMILVEKLG